MIRPLLFTVAMLSATPALANHFRAEPAAAPSRDRFAARDNAWTCAGTACVSARSGVRPTIVCTEHSDDPAERAELFALLDGHGYAVRGQTYPNTIFVDKKRMP